MSEIKVDTLTGKTTANNVTVTVGATATQSLEQGLVKHWCMFNSDNSTVTAADSLNLSSIGDNAAGQYYQNFTNNMGSTNYSCAGTTAGDSISSFDLGFVATRNDTTARSRSSKYDNAFQDEPAWSVQVFGDLA
tara:strand:+ start:342 stop:743 length:402 start_codon:yes stop_codon:yes gene_type:complete